MVIEKLLSWASEITVRIHRGVRNHRIPSEITVRFHRTPSEITVRNHGRGPKSPAVVIGLRRGSTLDIRI